MSRRELPMNRRVALQMSIMSLGVSMLLLLLGATEAAQIHAVLGTQWAGLSFFLSKRPAHERTTDA